MRVAHPAAKIAAESMPKLANFRSHGFFMIFRASFLVFSVPIDLKPVIPKCAYQKQKSQAAPEKNVAGLVHEGKSEIYRPNGCGDFDEEQGGGGEFLHAAIPPGEKNKPFARSGAENKRRYSGFIMFTIEL